MEMKALAGESFDFKKYLASKLREELLLVIGGYCKGHVLPPDVEVYLSETDSWHPLPSLNMPSGRTGHGAAAIGNMLYVTGGRYEHNLSENNSVIALDLNEPLSGWKECPEMLSKRKGGCTVAIDEKLYDIG